MNNKRRSLLKDAVLLLTRASTIVSAALDEEQDCLDDIPENLQSTDRYEAMEAAIDNLEEAIEQIDGAKDNIEAASA